MVCTQIHQGFACSRCPTIWRKRPRAFCTLACFRRPAGANRSYFALRADRQWFLAIYFAITIATIVITPWQNQFWRYLAPMAPLTLVFLMLALLAIRRWFGTSAYQWSCVAGTLITCDADEPLYCWFRSRSRFTSSIDGTGKLL